VGLCRRAPDLNIAVRGLDGGAGMEAGCEVEIVVRIEEGELVAWTIGCTKGMERQLDGWVVVPNKNLRD